MAVLLRVKKILESDVNVTYSYSGDANGLFSFDKRSNDISFDAPAEEAYVVRAARAILKARGDARDWPTSATYAA